MTETTSALLAAQEPDRDDGWRALHRAMLNCLVEHDGIGADELADAMGISASAANDFLARLARQGVVRITRVEFLER